MVQVALPVDYFQIADGANAIVRGRLGSFENLLGLMVEIVLLEDLDDEGNDRFWKVSIGNCKLNSTGYWTPYTARPVGGEGRVMGGRGFITSVVEIQPLLVICAFRQERYDILVPSEDRKMGNEV